MNFGIKYLTASINSFRILIEFSSFQGCFLALPGPSYFVSGRKYFPSRIVLNVTGDVTCYIPDNLCIYSLGIFPDITDHYRTQ